MQVLEINTKYSKKLKKVVTAWEAEYVSEENIENFDLEAIYRNAESRAGRGSRDDSEIDYTEGSVAE